jgi:hypothetical protein
MKSVWFCGHHTNRGVARVNMSSRRKWWGCTWLTMCWVTASVRVPSSVPHPRWYSWVTHSIFILLRFSPYRSLPPSQSSRTSRVDFTEALLLWQTAPFLCNARNRHEVIIFSYDWYLSWPTHRNVWRTAHAVSLGAQSVMEERILGIRCMNSLTWMYEKKRLCNY